MEDMLTIQRRSGGRPTSAFYCSEDGHNEQKSMIAIHSNHTNLDGSPSLEGNPLENQDDDIPEDYEDEETLMKQQGDDVNTEDSAAKEPGSLNYNFKPALHQTGLPRKMSNYLVSSILKESQVPQAFRCGQGGNLDKCPGSSDEASLDGRLSPRDPLEEDDDHESLNGLDLSNRPQEPQVNRLKRPHPENLQASQEAPSSKYFHKERRQKRKQSSPQHVEDDSVIQNDPRNIQRQLGFFRNSRPNQGKFNSALDFRNNNLIDTGSSASADYIKRWIDLVSLLFDKDVGDISESLCRQISEIVEGAIQQSMKCIKERLVHSLKNKERDLLEAARRQCTSQMSPTMAAPFSQTNEAGSDQQSAESSPKKPPMNAVESEPLNGPHIRNNLSNMGPAEPAPPSSIHQPAHPTPTAFHQARVPLPPHLDKPPYTLFYPMPPGFPHRFFNDRFGGIRGQLPCPPPPIPFYNPAAMAAAGALHMEPMFPPPPHHHPLSGTSSGGPQLQHHFFKKDNEQTEAMPLVVNTQKRRRTKVTDTRLSPRVARSMISEAGGRPDLGDPCGFPSMVPPPSSASSFNSAHPLGTSATDLLNTMYPLSTAEHCSANADRLTPSCQDSLSSADSHSIDALDSFDRMDGLPQTSTLTPVHLRKAKLMFFYTRYPNSSLLKVYFPDVKFNKNNTAQLVKWFSNFREFYYIQMEKYARMAMTEGVKEAEEIHVTVDSELYRALNLHYNRNNQIEVPDHFRAVVEGTLREFFKALSGGKDGEQSWKKPIYKVIARMDQAVPEFFKSPNWMEQLADN